MIVSWETLARGSGITVAFFTAGMILSQIWLDLAPAMLIPEEASFSEAWNSGLLILFISIAIVVFFTTMGLLYAISDIIEEIVTTNYVGSNARDHPHFRIV